ncbi:MAG: hypothetical protein E5V40_04310 [Mesorhizobium sp.]|nr:MAG: hypothetical protein E5V40_04310 [Mesorhizobium sp.]
MAAKRRYFGKRKADYIADCNKLRREVSELQSRLKSQHGSRVSGRLDAFRYVITEIEMADTLDTLLASIRNVVDETERDLALIEAEIQSDI